MQASSDTCNTVVMKRDTFVGQIPFWVLLPFFDLVHGFSAYDSSKDVGS
jgi:hypothetical protein